MLFAQLVSQSKNAKDSCVCILNVSRRHCGWSISIRHCSHSRQTSADAVSVGGEGAAGVRPGAGLRGKEPARATKDLLVPRAQSSTFPSFSSSSCGLKRFESLCPPFCNRRW